MAIDTTQKKIAVMEMDVVWEPGLPLLPGLLEDSDLWQLIWGYDHFPVIVGEIPDEQHDINRRMLVYLRAYFDDVDGEFMPLLLRYLHEEDDGDLTLTFLQLIFDATAATTP